MCFCQYLISYSRRQGHPAPNRLGRVSIFANHAPTAIFRTGPFIDKCSNLNLRLHIWI